MGIPRDCKSLRSGGSITTGLASGSRIPLDAPNGASVSYSPLAKLSASSHPVQRSQTNAEDQHEALHLKLKRNMLSIEAHSDLCQLEIGSASCRARVCPYG